MPRTPGSKNRQGNGLHVQAFLDAKKDAALYAYFSSLPWGTSRPTVLEALWFAFEQGALPGQPNYRQPVNSQYVVPSERPVYPPRWPTADTPADRSPPPAPPVATEQRDPPGFQEEPAQATPLYANDDKTSEAEHDDNGDQSEVSLEDNDVDLLSQIDQMC